MIDRPESFTLDDFTTPGWIARPEYCEYQGIGIAHIRRLHIGDEEIAFGKSPDHVAFVCFTSPLTVQVCLYEVNSWQMDDSISSVSPSFIVFVRTFEGVTEVQACPDNSPMPQGIIKQMQWIQALCAERGWLGNV